MSVDSLNNKSNRDVMNELLKELRESNKKETPLNEKSQLGANTKSNLNKSLIDKLYASDKVSLINPIEKKQKLTDTRISDLDIIIKNVELLKKSMQDFSSELTYLKRRTLINGSSSENDTLAIKVSSGVDTRKGKINVTQVAQNSTYESKAFKTRDKAINATGNFSFSIDGKDYNIRVLATDTLATISEKINNQAGDKSTAQVLKTGGDNPYKLLISSKKQGEKQNIQFKSGVSILGFKEIQKAQDAKLEYDGVKIQRSENKIEDLMPGVTFTIKKKGTVSFEIKQDLDGIKDKMKTFVKEYNNVFTVLDTATGYDNKTKKSGSFQGYREINSIKSDIDKLLFAYVDETEEWFENKNASENESKVQRRKFGITDYGLSINKEGKIKLDERKFDKTLADKGSKLLEQVFRGDRKIKSKSYISEAVGYEVQKIANPDGSIRTQKKAISSDIEFKAGDLEINGIKIRSFKLLASNTPRQNVNVVINAINAQVNDTGVKVKASVDGTKIVFTENTGEILKIKANDNVNKFLGIENTTIIGEAKEYNGVFKNIESKINSLVEGDRSILKNLRKLLSDKSQNFTDSIEKEKESLKEKYETMAEIFTAHNKMIKSFETQLERIKQSMNNNK